jgi:hypothetical protein
MLINFKVLMKKVIYMYITVILIHAGLPVVLRHDSVKLTAQRSLRLTETAGYSAWAAIL